MANKVSNDSRIAASSSMIKIDPVAGSIWCIWRRANTAETAASDIDCLPHHGKFKGKRSALTLAAVHLNLSSMFLDDSVGDGEPESGASSLTFAWFCLSSKKRIVNAIEVLGGDSRTSVRDHDSDPVSIIGADLQRATVRHRLLGV